jgi:hypothetical protein
MSVPLHVSTAPFRHVDYPYAMSSPTRVPFNTPTKYKSDRMSASRVLRCPLSCPESELDQDTDTDPFNVSLTGDTCPSLDNSLRTADDDDSLPDIHIAPTEYSLADMSNAEPMLVGLGIIGLCKKDGSAFDGTGIVGFSNSYPSFNYHPDQQENGMESPTFNLRPSDTLIEEVLFTFTSEPAQSRSVRRPSVGDDSLVNFNPDLRYRRSSLSRRKIGRDISVSTIFSELKPTTKIDEARTPIWKA